MPIWGWICVVLVVGLAVGLVALIAYANHALNKARDYTLEHGERVTGWLVQANSDLFRSGNADNPAIVLISPDPQSAEDEDYMIEIADAIMELKGVDCDDNDEAYVSSLVTDETYYEGKRVKLPKSFTGRANIYLCHLFIFREHLPNKKLNGRRVPCSIVWDEPKTMICTYPKASRDTKSRRRREDADD